MISGSLLSVVLMFGIREPLTIHKEILARQRALSSSTLDMQSVERGAIPETISSDSSIVSKVDLQIVSNSPSNMPVWRLIFQWQVLSASITTLVVGMLIGSLESVVPVYTKDAFGASSSKTGLLFVLNGSVAIVLSMPIGYGVDRLIGRHGEKMRMYIELVGLAFTGGAVLAIGLCKSFNMLIGVETLLAASMLVVNIPVMSSFGDFVNDLGLNSMAQCYGIYNSFWALSSSIAPPIATSMYAQIGYQATVAGVLTGLCVLCSVLILSETIWKAAQRATRRINRSSRY